MPWSPPEANGRQQCRLELVPRETPFVAQGEVVEGIDNSTAFMRAVIALQDGEVSRPTLIGNQYSSSRNSWSARHRIFHHLKGSKTRSATPWCENDPHALARAVDEWLTELQAGQSIEQLAQAFNTQTEQTGLFPRNGAIRKFGRPQEFIREVFRMRVGEDAWSTFWSNRLS